MQHMRSTCTAHAVLAAATVSGEGVLAMSQRQLPAQLRKLLSSRKGKKLNPVELQAKKPRVELSLR